MSVLNQLHFHEEESAYAWVEARVWPNGPVCPHCKGTERIGKMQGKTTRIGLYKCYACRKPFTVKVGTIFESSHIKMHVWLQAMFLLSSSKKGISGEGGLVKADETYFGNMDVVTTRTKKGKPGHTSKRVVLALVERGGSVRSFHVQEATKVVVDLVVKDNVARAGRLHTDESKLYSGMDGHFAEHQTVVHSRGQYVKGPKGPERIHTNSAEGHFGIFKRGMKGIYQHCAERHLHRYLAEFDFRYNNRVKLGVNDENDESRTANAVRGVSGKWLTYRTARIG